MTAITATRFSDGKLLGHWSLDQPESGGTSLVKILDLLDNCKWTQVQLPPGYDGGIKPFILHIAHSASPSQELVVVGWWPFVAYLHDYRIDSSERFPAEGSLDW